MAVFGKNSFDVYLHQWLKTAADGNVVAEFSLMENRYRAVCRKCKESLVFNYSTADDAISQTCQKWVAGHRHMTDFKKEVNKVVSHEEALVKKIFEGVVTTNLLPAARRRKFR